MPQESTCRQALGIAEFNARCRESVQRYVGEFEALTTRMGYWIDLSQSYWTMSPDYVDSVWWALKQIFDAGLAREVIRFVQDSRKKADLQVVERIDVIWSATGDVRGAIVDHAQEIARAVLALSLDETRTEPEEHPPGDGFLTFAEPELGLTVHLRARRGT